MSERRRSPTAPGIAAIAVAAAVAILAAAGSPKPPIGEPLPEFDQPDPGRWINSPPLSVEELRGDVLFVDVWTFG